jgi:hypothetical protein
MGLENRVYYTTAPDGYSKIDFTIKQKIEIFWQCFVSIDKAPNDLHYHINIF